jgi:hypothetical protein
MSDAPIDEKIRAKRAELRTLKAREATLREELAGLFKDKAQGACPIPLGTKVQYKDGRWGVVTRIGFFVDFSRVLDETEPVHWTVEGRRLTQAGEPGMKEFPALGPATHTLNGDTFERKPLGALWAVDDEPT